MKELRRQLKELLQQAGADAEVLEAFRQENAVFPFSAESRILMYLMNAQGGGEQASYHAQRYD